MLHTAQRKALVDRMREPRISPAFQSTEAQGSWDARQALSRVRALFCRGAPGSCVMNLVDLVDEVHPPIPYPAEQLSVARPGWTIVATMAVRLDGT